jgi:formylglycine-generating enzyme required for sulfatase activity
MALVVSTPAMAQPKAFRDCADCPEMVAIPAGRFLMGVAPGEESSEGLDPGFHHRSEPQHEVHVRRFSAGKYETTRREYLAFARATGRVSDGCSIWAATDFVFDTGKDWRDPGYPQDDRHPIVCVSWEDATAYTTWLGQRTGKRYRLLTEAEWEYAARAGTTTVRYWGDEREPSCAYANVADLATRAKVRGTEDWAIFECNDGHGYTAPVGSYRPNAFGLHDMLGNAWEWTQDCWNPNYKGAPADGSAWATGDCELRAVRGGSWEDSPVGVRSAYRVGSPVVIRVFLRGFRVARDD